jgi:hypothetical protein
VYSKRNTSIEHELFLIFMNGIISLIISFSKRSATSLLSSLFGEADVFFTFLSVTLLSKYFFSIYNCFLFKFVAFVLGFVGFSLVLISSSFALVDEGLLFFFKWVSFIWSIAFRSIFLFHLDQGISQQSHNFTDSSESKRQSSANEDIHGILFSRMSNFVTYQYSF